MGYQSDQEKAKVKELIDDIKAVHFKLGGDLPNFTSTNTSAFAYDKDKASKSKTSLDQELIKDLRSTHYKLGYQDNKMSSSSNSTYIPFNVNKQNMNNTGGFNDYALKRSSINLQPSNVGVENKSSIYMQDYTKKEIID